MDKIKSHPVLFPSNYSEVCKCIVLWNSNVLQMFYVVVTRVIRSMVICACECVCVRFDVKSTVQMDVWLQIHRLQICMHAHMHQTLMDLHLACKHAQTSM